MSTIPQIDPDTLRRQLAIAIPPPQPNMAAPSVTAGNAPPVLSSTQKQASLDSVKPAPQGVQMSSPAAPSLPAPSPLSIKAPRGSIQGDQSARANSLQEGPGIENIAHKIEGTQFGQNHPLLGKIAGYGLQVPAMIGDIAAEAASPISRLALSHVPGTFAHQADTLRGENQAIDQDVTNEEKQAQTREAQARTAQIGAPPPTEYTPLATDAGYINLNKHTGEAQPLTVNGEQAQPVEKQQNRNVDEETFDSLVKGGMKPLDAYTAMKTAANIKDPSVQQQYLDALESGDTAKQQAIEKTIRATSTQPKIDVHEATAQPAGEKEGVNYVVPGPNGASQLVRIYPGQPIPQGALTATQFGAQNAPTTQQRNVGAQASLVHEQMPATIAEIQKLSSQLGPVLGRWNDFMQGRVGAPNEEVAGLRSDLLMMSSAVALMHARGRLPENLREEFDKTINAPQQDPQNLITTLQHIDKWVVANQKAMGGAHESGSQGGGLKIQRDANGRITGVQ